MDYPLNFSSNPASAPSATDDRTAELQRALELSRVLKHVTDQIRSTLDSATILDTIVREVRQLLNTDRVVIYRFIEDWLGEVAVEAVVEPWISVLGKTYQDACFPEEHGQKYLEGRVRAVDHVANSDLTDCHKALLESIQVQANLVVPIRVRQKVWGLLLAHECRGPRVWQPFEIELLQQLAAQAAIAIQQAELYEQSCQQAIAAQAQAKQLEQTATDLMATLRELRRTQSQLVQTEKMSSLGQLVAGVAHEINNPVSFIYGNLAHASSYTHSLLEVIAAYQEQCPQPNDRTQAVLEAVDLEFLQDDFPKVLTSMRVGAERIRQIVQSLQAFSRADQVEKKPMDIHDGLESTLLILEHRLKPNDTFRGIQIIKDYGELPLVDCYGGQINQVFMNLLSNAIDAVEDRSRLVAIADSNPPTGQITIRTFRSEDSDTPCAVIQIADNGCGIDEAVQDHLFDPFFTTKPTGKGTGLGLSISYQIVVEKHNGTIQCRSHPNQGTEFHIEIPLSTTAPACSLRSVGSSRFS